MLARVQRLLLVEDEPAIRIAVRDALRAKGYEVDDTVDGAEALRRCRSGDYALIVLDVMLPGLDGFELCRTLRREGDRTPILMLTARGGEEDRVRGLSLGADDYLTKPFSVRELIARVEARLRRASWGTDRPPGAALAAPGVAVDLARLEARVEGREPASLTPREAAVLRYLAERPGRVVSREELLVAVWGYPPGARVRTRTVENTIGRLRKKIEPERKRPRVVRTVHGAGWKLGEEVRCDASS
ncbi:MAG: DNA-binding response regulator [Planctomycetota bacterium]|nr:MAG: DNA-binding response regulator [Planctomycetota bacterium]